MALSPVIRRSSLRVLQLRAGNAVPGVVPTSAAGSRSSRPIMRALGNRLSLPLPGREHTGVCLVRVWRRAAVGLASVAVVVIGLVAGCGPLSGHAGDPGGAPGGPPGSDPAPAGIHKIKHVIIVMQENRSFDHYFGTYPGAAGIPMRHGRPAACVPKPGGGCTRPYHLTGDSDSGGPHGVADAAADVNGGKMDGFIRQRLVGRTRSRPPSQPGQRNRGSPHDKRSNTTAKR